VPGLALFDLDNTLLDRDKAFSVWAHQLMVAHGLPDRAWAVIESADGDGLKPRDLFFAEAREQLGVETGVDDLLARYYVDYPACYTVDDHTVGAVRSLRTQGWVVGVVTNGPPSQRAKLEAAGLVDEFDVLCISSVVGWWKPDRHIFEDAARRCGLPLAGWMVGDSPSADIGGGRGVGLQTIWMPRGRPWEEPEFAPDATAHTIPEAVEIMVDSAIG
jgi:FMN phosphatase YigB (HAD superfamily)